MGFFKTFFYVLTCSNGSLNKVSQNSTASDAPSDIKASFSNAGTFGYKRLIYNGHRKDHSILIDPQLISPLEMLNEYLHLNLTLSTLQTILLQLILTSRWVPYVFSSRSLQLHSFNCVTKIKKLSPESMVLFHNLDSISKYPDTLFLYSITCLNVSTKL